MICLTQDIILYAGFDMVGGTKKGSVDEIAGVPVGSVERVALNDKYHAVVELKILKSVKLLDDSIASIRTKGLIGEKYVQIAPGGSEQYITHNGKIRETESSIDIEEVLSKYVFEKIQTFNYYHCSFGFISLFCRRQDYS